MLAGDQDHRLWGEFVPLDCEAGAGRFGEGGAGKEVQPLAGEWEFVIQLISDRITGARESHAPVVLFTCGFLEFTYDIRH